VQTILVDTGVLLRAFDRSSPVQKSIFRAFRKHWNQGNLFVTSHQNIAEFWNVATRPASARGGFGLSVDETLKRVQTIEKLGMVLPFTNACYLEWRQLLVAHSIIGVSVHDARIVATMKSHGISHLLTLNDADFQRYSGITVLTPDSIT
jgi:predicted nucleic acid-binding protein